MEVIENLDDLILLNVFSYLPYKSLIRSMRVCKKWNLLISEILTKRKRYPQTLLFKSAKWTQINSNEVKNEIKKVDFLHEITPEISDLCAEPSLVLILLNKTSTSKCITDTEADPELHLRPKRVKGDSNQTKTTILTELTNQLPKKASKLFVYNDGIIGTDLKLKKAFELESDFEVPCFSGLFIPKSDFYRFDLKEVNSNTSLPEFSTEEDFNSFLGIKTDETLKFILILLDGNSKLKFRAFLKFLNRIRLEKGRICLKDSFACSGAIVNEMKNGDSKRSTKMSLISLVAKNSEDYVKVSQIVIPDSPVEKCRDIWKEKSDLLKTNGVYSVEGINERYLGFQVSCCGRGKEYHNGEESVEANLFLKSFPNAPLVGLFGYGEIGVDHVPDYKNEIGRNLLRDLNCKEFVLNDIVSCGFTTIFTLISLRV